MLYSEKNKIYRLFSFLMKSRQQFHRHVDIKSLKLVNKCIHYDNTVSHNVSCHDYSKSVEISQQTLKWSLHHQICYQHGTSYIK